jgi:methylase of polypeptide subunit release factors
MTAPLASTAAARALATLGSRLLAARYRFTTVTPATHRRVNARPENARAHDLRGVFGWSRPYDAGVLPPQIDALLEDARLAEPLDDVTRRALVRASTIGSRLYFHSPFPTDDADAVFFGPDTYRYVAALQRWLAALPRPVRRAVDIGAGSGAAAIELALACPSATVIAADINPAALALSGVNARLNDAGNVAVRESNLLDGVSGDLDLVMSNPPYILDEDQLAYRHGGGEHGAALSIRLVRAALDRLRPGGTLLLYTGVAMVDGEDGFLKAVRRDLDDACAAWSYQELDPDVFGGQLACKGYEQVERIAAVWLQAAKA